MSRPYYIAPSLLAADFSKLGQEVADIAAASADWLHLDIMDGHFVPNISFGAALIRTLRPLSRLTFDAHLMIEHCDDYIEEFAKSGCDIITIHIENNYHIHRSLSKIRELGKKAGVAINPGTPLQMIECLLPYIDLILIMSVNPGFGGQSFIKETTAKIAATKQLIGQHAINIEVDGGVNENNIGQLAASGANVFVAGSYIYKNGTVTEYTQRIAKLRQGIKL